MHEELLQSANNGDTEAMFKLACRFRAEQNTAESIKWFEKAAKAGHYPAQMEIGNTYRHGWGVEKDDERARFYYTMAAEQGGESAVRALEEMDKIDRLKREVRRTAVHEAGHAVVALFDEPPRAVNCISIYDDGSYTSVDYTSGELIDQVKGKLSNLFGGRNAEIEIFGTADTGCNNDMHKVFDLLEACGINDALKMEWILEANNRATEILHNHHDVILLLTDNLIAKGKLDFTEIKRIIG